MSFHETVIGFLLSTLIIIFNAMQIYIMLVSNKKKLATPMLFILNLSISDLLLGCILAVMMATGQGTTFFDQNSKLLSPPLSFLFYTSLIASTGMLIAITIDRLQSVAAPMKYRQRRRKTVLTYIALTWITAMTYCAVNIFIVYPRYPDLFFKIVNTMFFVVAFITIVLMIVCYAFILHYIRKQNKQMNVARSSSSTIKSSAEYRILKEAKLRKIAFAVIFSYVLCFSPNSFKYLLVVSNVVELVHVPTLSFLTISNSLWNTLLYFGCIRQKLYRKAKKVFTS